MSKDNTMDKTPIKCSFCGKTQSQVKKLVAGPGVYICDECVELCSEIVDESFSDIPEEEPFELPKPKEIKAILRRLCYRTRRCKTSAFCCGL